MAVSRFRVARVASAAGALLLPRRVDGHCWQQFPISRQYSRTRALLDETDENPEHAPCYFNSGSAGGEVKRRKLTDDAISDPEVLSAKGNGRYPLLYMEGAGDGDLLATSDTAERANPCGDPEPRGGQRYSTSSREWEVLHTFNSGQQIEIEVVIGVYHYGHFEFFLCDTQDLDDPDGIVDQECFNKHPLTRVYNKNDASQIDPNFPGRYYTDPPCRVNEVDQGGVPDFDWPGNPYTGEPAYKVKMRYTLPDIECEHCVLQMHWLTGDRCKHLGYDDFDPPLWNSECAPNTEDWIYEGWVSGARQPSICGEQGSFYPEDFWQYSDIALTRSKLPAVEEAWTYEYLGCFADEDGESEEDRALDRGFSSDSGMTLELCAKHCAEKSRHYMGLEHGTECYCGSKGAVTLQKQYRSGTCEIDCSGAPDETCGGHWSFDYYYLG